jgi:mono/diheme cytochrome c family protein
VFGWAIEWVVFLVELAFAAAYYYTWNRIPDRLHLRLGYLYAGISFLTLAIINGILTFMLTPSEAWLGVAGSGQEATVFFQAFFNPTYWPSLALRTLVCFSMAGIFALVVFSRLDGDKDGAVKKQMIQWSAMWLLPSFFLMPFFQIWYLWLVPESQRELLSLGISTIGMGVFTQVTRMSLITLMTSATIVIVVYLLAYRNAKDFRFGTAMVIVFLAFLATGATEGVRETLRKPYVITEFMYSNGTRKNQVAGFNAQGYLTGSPWAPDKVAAMAQTNPAYAENPIGYRMFLGQCMACHTVDGYRSMRALLQGRNEESIGNILKMLHEPSSDSPYAEFMPPLVGNAEEIAALRSYLHSLVKDSE